LLVVALGATHDIKGVVDTAVHRVMTKDAIPGMGVGVIVDGKSYVFNYGRAAIAPDIPVTNDTLFEVGSVSKTLTATLTSLAQVDGKLSLTDRAAKYVPMLRGSAFGDLSLINLGTHTSGGLPLQVPDDVQNNEQLIRYLKDWRRPHAPGTIRTYSNISIGMLGVIAANAYGTDFVPLMEQRILRPLELDGTYYNVPASKMHDYAEGYRKGAPIRMTPGVLWQQAYGVRTTASSLLRFVAANMNLLALDPALQRAITDTHTGYFKTASFTQDLIWEQFPEPVTLQMLRDGNAATMLLDPHPVTPISPVEKPREDVWINKTGTTNGFGAYVAFIPARRCGVVLLANENYPIPDRVATAYSILSLVC
jgi:beta-lactamase class C